MKTYLKYLFIQLGLIFFFVFLLSPIFIREKFDINREGGQATFNLSTGKIFTQKIEDEFPNLNSISLQLKNPMINNNSEITVDIYDSNNNILQKNIFFGSNVGDPSWVKLKFTPLSNPGYQIKIYADPDPDHNLYLYVNQNNQMDLKATSYLPGFFNRFQDNFYYQIGQLKARSEIDNTIYFTVLILLNVYLLKLSLTRSL